MTISRLVIAGLAVCLISVTTISAEAQVQGKLPEPVPPTPALERADTYVEDQFYIAGPTGGLYLLDEAGTVTLVANTGVVFYDVAFANGQLYGISDSALYRISPTGVATRVGATGVFLNAMTSDANGMLYAAGGGALYRIPDPTTGAAQLIGSFGGGYTSAGDLAFNPTGGLYASVNIGGSIDAVAIVNRFTGAIDQVLGNTGYANVYGLMFRRGELFAVTAGGHLLTVSTYSGLATLVGSIGVEAWGMTAMPETLLAAQVRRTSTNTPIRDARVFLIDDFDPSPPELRSNENGVAVFAGVAPGAYRVVAEHLGRESEILPVVVIDGETTVQKLEIPAETILAGRIVDSWTGTGIPGAKVSLIENGTMTGQSVVTNGLGEYRFALQASGAYSVFAEKWVDPPLVEPKLAYQLGQSGIIDVVQDDEIHEARDLALDTRTVVLVHGINSSYSRAFGVTGFSATLESAGWLPLGMTLPGKAMDANKWGMASIPLQAQSLAGYIDEQVGDAGVQSYWIVAHSQGGLVSRYFIKEDVPSGQSAMLTRSQTVRGLISLGTPHHGSPLAKSRTAVQSQVCDFYAFCPPEWEDLSDAEFLQQAYRRFPALEQLVPDSRFLKSMNTAPLYLHDWEGGLCENDIRAEYDLILPRTAPAPYFASISGRYSFWNADALEWKSERLVRGASGCEINDTVVPRWSSHLHADDGTREYLRNYHTEEDVAGGDGLTHEGMLSSQGLQNFVIGLLQTSPDEWQASSQLDPEVRRRVPSSWAFADGGGVLIFGGQALADSFIVGSTDSLRVTWASVVGRATISLESPSGAVLDSASAQADPQVEFRSPAAGSGGSLTIAAPSPGPWRIHYDNTVNVLYDRVDYLVESQELVRLELSATSAEDGSIVVRATLLESFPVAPEVEVEAVSVGPSDVAVPISLADDGFGVDELAGDGVYSGSYLPEPGAATTVVGVTMRGLPPQPFERSATASVTTFETTDLAVQGEPSLSSATYRAGGTLTISAAVANEGTLPVTCTAEVFHAGSLAPVSRDTLDLDPGTTAPVVASHVPLWTGLHEYTVIVRPLGEASESDWQDNLATASIQIGPIVTGMLPQPPEDSVPPEVRQGVGILSATPNPFNPSLTVEFANGQSGRVTATVFDVRGRRVRQIMDRHLTRGVHRMVWVGDQDDGTSVASGVYFIRISGPGGTDVRKVALVR